MNKDTIISQALAYRHAVSINTVPWSLRILVRTILWIAFLLSLSLLTLTIASLYIPAVVRVIEVVPVLASSMPTLLVSLPHLVFLVVSSFSLLLLAFGLEGMFLEYYLKGVRRVFSQEQSTVTYEVAEVFLTSGYFFENLARHKESKFLFERLMLTKESLIETFRTIDIPYEMTPYMEGQHVTLGSLFRALYLSDQAFASHLFTLGVQKDAFIGTTIWMDRLLETKKLRTAWWWRENLSKTRGFAKTLSYGMTQYMSRFADEMVYDNKMRELGSTILHQEEMNKLEEILSKNHGANAVIVGPRGSGRYTVALALARAINEGGVYSEIEFKRMFLLKAGAFELINSKEELEYSIISVFNEAVVARNIIFVIDDVVKLSELCHAVGCDFLSLIDPYISHTGVSVVILTDEAVRAKDSYRRVFDERFETIVMRDLSEQLFLPFLEDKALASERFSRRIFSYQALLSTARMLHAYFVEDAPLVKAGEVIRFLAEDRKEGYVTSDDVDAYLKTVTGVSTGKVHEEEKETLLHLETILEEQVKGQKEALLSIARTMRRIRSGVVSGEKPMGTFLFLGPTGSGKTETAKTLARVFFGSEEHMSRIDMGEYALPLSAERLLGNENEEGDLARLVHARPYGVLLLDEFEKSSKDVKDLFLRILDEGVFTNGMGKVVSLRSQIIIATSNAGTQFILESGLSASDTEEKIAEVKQRVIGAVLEQGIFKPELVNRFDGTVMYLPLSQEATEGVAGKMLEELRERVVARGYDVTWAPDVVAYVAQTGNVAEFGGRAIQRTIQDTVEDVLSKKIIDGTLAPGGTVTISRNDIEGV